MVPQDLGGTAASIAWPRSRPLSDLPGSASSGGWLQRDGSAPRVGGQGYEGSYAAVAKYVSPWRESWHGQEEKSTVRFETGPGEQSQVDWGSTWVYLGEARTRVHVFTMVLGYSRRLFARPTPTRVWRRSWRAMRKRSPTSGSHGHDPLRQPADDRHVEGGVHRPGGMERELQGPDGLLRGGGQAVPVLPGADEGQGGEWGQVRQGNALAGRRFRDLEDLNTYLLDWCRGWPTSASTGRRTRSRRRALRGRRR